MQKVVDFLQISVFVFICWAIFVVEQYSNEWVEPLLLTMVAGVMISNYTKFKDQFMHILHVLSPYVFLFFFTVTGASLQLDAFANALMLASTLFFVRIAGLFTAAYVAGRAGGDPEIYNRRAGFTYITQAGVSLGLAKQIQLMFPAWGAGFTTTIVTAVVASQIIGPPLHKAAIRSTGEAAVVAGSNGALFWPCVGVSC